MIVIIINSTTVVVNTGDELKTILEGNNSYNYIYFGNNITLTNGINISSSKDTITIDGTYNNIRYIYEYLKSLLSNNTISFKNITNKYITIKNMTIIGHNYYGIIYVPEETNLQNIIIEYNNVNYEGPQITYHPTGLTKYINCSINIITSFGTANEVAECNRIEIGGTTNINHTGINNSIFWFRGNNTPYLKILENAIVEINSSSRELFYGVSNLSFFVLKGSQLKLTSANGMGYNNYATSDVLIDENASVTIIQTTGNGSYASWYCNGSFTMNPGSSLYMTNNFVNLLGSNNNLYFTTSKASLTLNNPKAIVIYNNKTSAIYTDSQINFGIRKRACPSSKELFHPLKQLLLQPIIHKMI